MFKWLHKFRKSESGQGMVEYGLVLALISVVTIGSLGGVGDTVSDIFDKVKDVEISNKEDETIPVYPNFTAKLYNGEEIDAKVKEGYIPISNAEELNNLREGVSQIFGDGTAWEKEYSSGLSGKYVLVSDLDLSAIDNFEPIGNSTGKFTGDFDGGGYVIRNLRVNNGTKQYTGLFGYVDGADFRNIGLVDVDVKGGNYIGGLVGRQHNKATIKNSYATGKVTGTGDYVGGLAGYQNEGSTVTDSYATGDVYGDNWAGGLVGRQHGTVMIKNGYATGNVSGTGDYVGGLVGSQFASSKIIDSYATGKVTATGSQVGGLIGRQTGTSTVATSYATGEVTGIGDMVGGLVGYQNNATVENCFYDTNTTGQTTSDGGEGKVTDEMKKQTTYVGWDFAKTWKIIEDQYPILQ